MGHKAGPGRCWRAACQTSQLMLGVSPTPRSNQLAPGGRPQMTSLLSTLSFSWTTGRLARALRASTSSLNHPCSAAQQGWLFFVQGCLLQKKMGISAAALYQYHIWGAWCLAHTWFTAPSCSSAMRRALCSLQQCPR